MSSPSSSVQVRQHELIIPSAPVRPGRLPLIGLAAQDCPVHPYRPLADIQFGRLEPQTFRAITLENEFLRLTVLPELGGRLHRAVYKPAGYDLFYHNDAIRAQLISSRGAWYAGGVEFNFPTSHSLTTHAGVEHATRQLPDGSAAIIVSNTCRMSRMRWEVAIRIAPGSSAISFHTRLINRTAWPQRYYYWLNAAVPQGPQIRYHFSASKLIGHTQEVDGNVTRLDSFPIMRNGADARVPARLPDTVSVFMLDNNSGFFGYYDLDADLGFVRSAPIRDVPGNKIWSWGDTDYGNRFNERLLPPGKQFYGELQSGRPESQTDWAIIEPFEVIDAGETWYPIPRLGGMTDGSREVTIHARPEAGRLRLIANRSFENLHVSIHAGARDQASTMPHHEQSLCGVRVGEPADVEFPATSQPIRVRVTTPGGRVVLDYRDLATQPTSIITDLYETKAAMDPPRTPHELTVRGLLHYRAYEWQRAEETLAKALAADANFAPAHRWLGFMLRLRGRPADALPHLKAALLADPMDYAAYYQYAALLAETDSPEHAALELQRVMGNVHGQFRAWAAVLLARAFLQLGRFDDARQLLADRPADVAFGPLGRLAYRLPADAPEDVQAAAPAPNSPWRNPTTDLFVQLIDSCLAATRSDEGAKGSVFSVLDAWWATNVKSPDEAADAVLEVAEELLDLADADRARAVLEWLTSQDVLRRVCPLAHYRLGELAGDLPAAVRRASEITDRDAMSWPGWLSHLPLLERAVAAAPDNALAHSLLGLLRLALSRPGEAAAALEIATRLDPNDALAWRNLGLARWQLGGDFMPALDAYQHAIALWPDYATLIGECDRMLADLGSPADRRRELLYDNLHPSLADSDVIAVRRADLALATGDFTAGLAQIAGRQFHPGEGRFDTHRLFIRLNIREGERLAAAGDWPAALDHFRMSLVYPKNIQMGRPARAQESRQHWLVATALERLGDSAAANAELGKLVAECLRYVPVELYFGVLAQRKLGSNGQADRWLKLLIDQTERRAGSATAEGAYWAVVGQALLERVRGNRAASNAKLAELNIRPGDDLEDFVKSELY